MSHLQYVFIYYKYILWRNIKHLLSGRYDYLFQYFGEKKLFQKALRKEQEMIFMPDAHL